MAARKLYRMPSEMTYGERLEFALLKVAKLPPLEARAKLAKALGVSVQALSMVINGKSKSLTAENHMKAARFLAVDAWWLAVGEGEPRPLKMSKEALQLAELYDRLDAEGRKQFWLVLQVVRAPVPDDVVEKHLPLPPGPGDGVQEQQQKRFSKSRAD